MLGKFMKKWLLFNTFNAMEKQILSPENPSVEYFTPVLP
jgi:hypothetical protein